MNFEILSRKHTLSLPLVVHVPHSSTIIPPAIRQSLRLNDSELKQELLCMTDWYTDRLFDGVMELGGVLFINRLSRLVVDPERFPDDTQEVMAAKGMGAVYKSTSDGRLLRHGLSSKDRDKLLDKYFHPYAEAFEDVVATMIEQHGRCVILDGHSFPSVPLPYELDQRRDRPQLCIGTDSFHTPATLIPGIQTSCAAEGLHVEQNRPFAGTYVPLRYWRTDPRVASVMVEIRRDLYMDEATGTEAPGFERTRESMLHIMQRIAEILTS